MNREDFLDGLKEQYAEEIHEAYCKCEFDDGQKVDYPALEELLVKVKKHAMVDGLPDEEFDDLVQSTLPEAYGQIDLSEYKKAA